MGKRAISIHGHFYQPCREDENTAKSLSRKDQPFRSWIRRSTMLLLANATLEISAHQFRPGTDLDQLMLSYDPATLAKIISQNGRTLSNMALVMEWRNHTITPFCRWQNVTTKSPRLGGASRISLPDLGTRRQACGCLKQPWTKKR